MPKMLLDDQIRFLSTKEGISKFNAIGTHSRFQINASLSHRLFFVKMGLVFQLINVEVLMRSISLADSFDELRFMANDAKCF